MAERVSGAGLAEDGLAWALWGNIPVVIDAACTETWPSRMEWVDADGKPRLDVLDELFGDASVDVAVCTERAYSDQPRIPMKMREYTQYLRKAIIYGTDELLYLKDWHFARDYPNYTAYSVPPPFRNDWLNSYWDTEEGGRDDYRFCYIGADGTWTPLHADVFCSYSWSANICGVKEWTLFPPSEAGKLFDAHGNLPFDIRSVDDKQFPLFQSAQRVVLIQHPGECVFVPSGWFHQVHNKGCVISINHNWGNEANVYAMWRRLHDDFRRVQHELDDCKGLDDWPAQCQMLLRAHSGMNFEDFRKYLKHGCDRRGISLSREGQGTPREDLVAAISDAASASERAHACNNAAQEQISLVLGELMDCESEAYKP